MANCVRVFLTLGLMSSAAMAREWTDNSGSYHVEAQMEAIDRSSVSLKKQDGVIVKLPLDKLSDVDRQYAKMSTTTATLQFDSGGTAECTILQTNKKDLTVLYGHSVIRQDSSAIKVTQAITEVPGELKSSPRLPNYRAVLISAAVQTWATDLRQIPSTVIDNGILRNVPYASYNAGRNYEINVYGDPDDPAGFEIGIRKQLLTDPKAKENCIAFICSLLGDPADRKAVRGISLEKGKNEIVGVTFEITPPTDPDAYEGWWVSAYNEKRLDKERATDKELAAITVPRSEIAKVAEVPRRKPANSTDSSASINDSQSENAPLSLKHSWSQEDLSYARSSSGSSKSTGGSVYVRGYTRKDGTYVHSHSRSSPHR